MHKPYFPGTVVAFSLVEAVLSIAVVSFAMVAIFGMIPVGLVTFRNAMNLTIESTIVQSVSEDLQRAEYAAIVPNKFVFDEQGIQLLDEEDARLFYTAEVLAPSTLKASELVSSSAGKTVVIKISNRAQPDVANTYFAIVPRTH